MAERCRIFEITTDRGGRITTALYAATTRGKARADAWRTAHECWGTSFANFVKATRVRAYGGPIDDCYGYIRRAYGVSVRIGERVSVTGEGDGEVVYPNASTTARVHVLFDGKDFALPVHPHDIVQEAAYG